MEPQARIKVKSLAWIEDGDSLFVVSMFDQVKNHFYCRPVGGGVEFGEPARAAVEREVREELDTEITITGDPLILENIFTYEGGAGHEIVYLFPCQFVDKSFYERKAYPLTEIDGSQWQAMWVKRSDCLDGTVRLVPETLLEWYKTHPDSAH
jgi:8-oxo-dGTP pyrophosphatase MutT (NUDIX family)